MMIIVPESSNWEQFLISNDGSACSGLGSCDHCNKKMYPKRAKYLKSWMHVYAQNKSAIKNADVVMPRLQWVAAETAEQFNLGDFHKTKCKLGNSIRDCDCDTALLFRTMYYNPKDSDIEPSLNIIYPVFSKANKWSKPNIKIINIINVAD